jgi:TPR repeat protein
MFGFAFCLDLGAGVPRDTDAAIRWYRAAWRAGATTAASNLATVLRDRSDLAGAFRWWRRAAAVGDGDALVDVGYAQQYGLGTRRNPRLARASFESAIHSSQITEFGREEAMYHLAVLLLDEGSASARRRARSLLRRASAGGDFPEAAGLLAAARAGSPSVRCRCRRGYARKGLGQAECPAHPRTPA